METIRYLQNTNLVHPETGKVTDIGLFLMPSGAIVGLDMKYQYANCTDLYSPYEPDTLMEEKT